jgi:hypothetical protein
MRGYSSKRNFVCDRCERAFRLGLLARIAVNVIDSSCPRCPTGKLVQREPGKGNRRRAARGRGLADPGAHSLRARLTLCPP